MTWGCACAHCRTPACRGSPCALHLRLAWIQAVQALANVSTPLAHGWRCHRHCHGVCTLAAAAQVVAAVVVAQLQAAARSHQRCRPRQHLVSSRPTAFTLLQAPEQLLPDSSGALLSFCPSRWQLPSSKERRFLLLPPLRLLRRRQMLLPSHSNHEIRLLCRIVVALPEHLAMTGKRLLGQDHCTELYLNTPTFLSFLHIITY